MSRIIPVCVECCTMMHTLKNGVAYIETYVSEGDTLDYRLTYCDMYECPICKHRVLGGFALAPYKEHFDVDFNRIVRRTENGKEGIDWIRERK